MKEKPMDFAKDVWDYIYGSKSHMNLAGKVLIGIPLAPLILIAALTYLLLDNIFTKKK